MGCHWQCVLWFPILRDLVNYMTRNTMILLQNPEIKFQHVKSFKTELMYYRFGLHVPIDNVR